MNKKTNILIVNDDGIESYGIAKLGLWRQTSAMSG